MLAKARSVFAGLPRAMRAGLSVTVLGGGIDIVYHLGAGVTGSGHDSVAMVGHVVTLIGMLVTMLGLIGVAVRSRPFDPSPTSKGITE